MSMDRVDPSDCWSSAALYSSSDDTSANFKFSYLESFLPVYQAVNQAANSKVTNRYQAIKFAADASLAMTAGGAKWSDALGKQLAETCREAAQHRREDDMRAGAATTGHSGEIELPSPTARTGCEACELAGGEEVFRVDFDGDSVEESGGTECMETDGSRMSYHSNLSSAVQNGTRLSVLKALLRRNRSKKNLTKRYWKPKATVRKMKTLSKSRRRFSLKRTQSVESQIRQESDQRMQNSLQTLQALVPGGGDMDAALLLDQTADFLTFLKLQVQALQSVACAVDEQFSESSRL